MFSSAPNTTDTRLGQTHRDDGRLMSVFMMHSPFLAWLKDDTGRYLFVNDRLLKRFNLTREQIVEKTDHDVFPAEVAALVRANDLEVTESNRPMEMVEEVPAIGSAEVHSWLVTKFPMPQYPRGYVGGIALEITALKSAERERASAEAAHRQILDAMPDMVLVKGPGSRLEWANKAFREAYGLTNEQLRGLIDAPFVAPDLTEQYVKDDLKVFETGLSLDIPEEPLRKVDGVTTVVHTVKSPVFDQSGKVIKTVGVSRDITYRKRLEQELRQAQKLESIGQLASGVAHEINTPIQFVGDQIGFLETSVRDMLSLCGSYRSIIAKAKAGDGRLTDEDYASLTEQEDVTDMEYAVAHLQPAFVAIRDGVSRVTSLVQALKQFGHPDATELRPADVNEALRSTLTIAANEIKYVASVETDFGAVSPVLCQVGALNQVFLNLLVNAAHAIGDVVRETGALGTITVRTTQDQQQVTVAISDTGGGIPENIREKIFEPFFTTKEVGRGTGQGLAIAHLVVVEKHNGTLTFDTQMGKGTTFYVRLPVDPTAPS